MEVLPRDVIDLIITWLDYKSILAMKVLSHRYYKIYREGRFWKIIYERYRDSRRASQSSQLPSEFDGICIDEKCQKIHDDPEIQIDEETFLFSSEDEDEEILSEEPLSIRISYHRLVAHLATGYNVYIATSTQKYYLFTQDYDYLLGAVICFYILFDKRLHSNYTVSANVWMAEGYLLGGHTITIIDPEGEWTEKETRKLSFSASSYPFFGTITIEKDNNRIKAFIPKTKAAEDGFNALYNLCMKNSLDN